MPLAGARSTGRGKDGWPPPLVDRGAQRKSRSPVTPRHNPPEDWAKSVVRNTFEIAEATGQLARLHTPYQPGDSAVRLHAPASLLAQASSSCPRPSTTPATRNSPGPRSATSPTPPPPPRHAATAESHDPLDKDHRHNAAVRKLYRRTRILCPRQGPQGTGHELPYRHQPTSRTKRYNHAHMLGGDVQARIPLVVAADSGGVVLPALTAPSEAWMCLPGRPDVRIRILGADRRIAVTLPIRPVASRSIGDRAAALIDRLLGPHPPERDSRSAGLLALARNLGHVRLLVRLR